MAYLDNQGVEYLWSKLSLEDYPNNEMLIAVLNAIDDTKLDKSVFEEYTGATVSSIEPAIDDIPKVYIDGTIPTTKDEVTGKLTYISKTLSFVAYIKIKCQGTSSLSYAKKNFTVKLFEDENFENKLNINFKGWGEQNKFCLKANWIDISHARNIVSAKLWGDIVRARSRFDSYPEEYKTSPNCGAIDGFPIQVYCNGLYWGRYTWNIPKDGWMSNMDDSLETHCILGSENYESGCFRAAAVIDESDWTDELHDECPESIKTSLNNAITFVMTSSDEDFVANIENYFDLPSLIDYYIFSYACCHLDGLGKNQLLFTYDGTHWIAGAYDLDSTWGLYWDGASFVSTSYRMQADYETGVHGTSNLLYERLENLFSEQIKERWIELRENVLSNINVIRKFEDFMNICPPYIVEQDYWTTTGNGAFTNIPSPIDNNIGQIRDYAVKRLKYVNTKLNPPESGGDSGNITGTTMLRENYSPNGESFEDTATIDFSAGDYIEVSMDLTDCYGVWENILSIGDSIYVWNMSGGYHIYYTADTNTMQVNVLQGTQHIPYEITIIDPSNVILKINSDGIYYNETLIATSTTLADFTKIEIGSQEGNTRSNATYKYIKVVTV